MNPSSGMSGCGDLKIIKTKSATCFCFSLCFFFLLFFFLQLQTDFSHMVEEMGAEHSRHIFFRFKNQRGKCVPIITNKKQISGQESNYSTLWSLIISFSGNDPLPDPSLWPLSSRTQQAWVRFPPQLPKWQDLTANERW